MTLRASGNPIANVNLTDTFNTWRIRTNQALADGASISGVNSFSAEQTFTTITAAGPITAPTVTANTFSGSGASLTSLPAGQLTGTVASGAVSGSYTGITGVGALDAGSITSNFGNIDVGTSNIDGGTITADTSLVGTLGTAAQPNVTSLGTLTSLATSGNATVSGNLTVDGNATFNGNTTIVEQTTISTTDALLHLASNNEFSDTLDIGFFGHYNLTGSNSHAGFIRDSGTKEFYVFGRLDTTLGSEPTDNIDINAATFELANVHVDVLKSNKVASNGAITAPVVSANTVTLATSLDGGGATYTNLHGAVNILSTSNNRIDFSSPLNKKTMSAATTFTEANKAADKITTFILDTNTSDFTPTFSLHWNWSSATEPTWADYRYWVISAYCFSANSIIASATGHDIA